MIPEIILLRAIGILLVVFGHSDIGGQGTPYFYPALERVVYTIHMPLFMFISGFVFMYTNQGKDRFDFVGLIKNKILRLLVPAFFVLTLAFLLRALLTYSKKTGMDFYSITNYAKMFFLKEYLPIEFYWFLFVLFDIFLLSRLFLYCIKIKYATLLLTLIFMALNLFPIDIDLFYVKFISEYLVYFWFGCLCCFATSETRLLKLVNDRNVSLILSIGFLVLLIYFGVIEKITKVGGLICSISGISISYFCVRYLNQFKLIYLRSIGKYSYQIFLLSWFFHRIVETIGFKELKLSFWVTFPLSFILAIIGPLLTAKMIETKAPQMRFVVGL
jgi:fucose 4-O-acetylase-like acetyltransferase